MRANKYLRQIELFAGDVEDFARGCALVAVLSGILIFGAIAEMVEDVRRPK